MGSLQYTSNIIAGDGDGAIYLVSGVKGFYNEYYCIIPMLNGGSTLYSILVVLLDKRTKSNLGLNEGNTTVFPHRNHVPWDMLTPAIYISASRNAQNILRRPVISHSPDHIQSQIPGPTYPEVTPTTNHKSPINYGAESGLRVVASVYHQEPTGVNHGTNQYPGHEPRLTDSFPWLS